MEVEGSSGRLAPPPRRRARPVGSRGAAARARARQVPAAARVALAAVLAAGAAVALGAGEAGAPRDGPTPAAAAAAGPAAEAGPVAAGPATAGAAVAGPTAAGPRPLTAAEQQGVELAVAYMVGGPAAWWPELARGSWLRALGRDAALAEIEARAGTPAEAHWTLQAVPAEVAAHGAVFSLEFPSGADDTLLIGLVEEGGAWKIDSLRVGAEPGGGGGARGGAAAVPVSSGAPESGHGAAPGWTSWLLPGALAAGGLAAVGAAVAWARRRRRARPAPPVRMPGRASFAMARPERTYGALALGTAGAALLALAAAVAGLEALRGGGPDARGLGPGAVAAGGPETAGAGGAGGVPVRLGALLPLRRALTAPGGAVAAAAAVDAAQSDAAVDALAAAAGGDAAAGSVALLWRAQHRIDRGDLLGTESLLRRPEVPAAAPLAELLRARLALLRLQQVETGLAYERALSAGVAHEGVLIEAAQALSILGFEETAKRYLHELEHLGARNAEVYYDLADQALIDGQNLEAHRDFRLGWRLQPIARAELLAQPLSAFMLQDRELRRMMSLGSVAEPLGACGGAATDQQGVSREATGEAAAGGVARRALALPSGVAARLLGEELRLTAGTAEVRAPGACELAPPGTPQEGATAWQEQREAAALARVPELRRLAGSAGALAQPVLRRQTEEAALALAVRQRWPELIEITAGLAQPAAILPARLTRLRAAALTRLDRLPEARQLLVRLALGDKASKRADPAALYQLAGLLERSGDFDQAIRLVGKANSELPSPPGGDRLLQLQMEKRLAASMERLESPHFVVSYPLSRGPAFGKEAMRVLEAERGRLQKWIPLPAGGGAPIDVRLLPFEDFELGFSQGGEVLGLYDGVVRVPLGSLRVFTPPAVAIMTHELAHAMIAQRTGDRAPHWFHEGLAQHVEMQEEGRVNPIGDYRLTDRLLAFPLLEPALQSFASAVWVSAAYDEALWTMNYVEARYGVAGIHRLMDAFRAGQTTGEALASALGAPEARFDQELWTWCTSQAPRAWRVEVVRYDGGAGTPHRL